ncbi:MAG: hypothetical protein ACRD3W_25210 [Terriglobales bacterium]
MTTYVTSAAAISNICSSGIDGATAIPVPVGSSTLVGVIASYKGTSVLTGQYLALSSPDSSADSGTLTNVPFTLTVSQNGVAVDNGTIAVTNSTGASSHWDSFTNSSAMAASTSLGDVILVQSNAGMITPSDTKTKFERPRVNSVPMTVVGVFTV